MPWSSSSPRASRMRQKLAWRASGTRASTLLAICGTAAPDTRTTPMPPCPAPVAIAAMVSRLISPLDMGRLVAIEHALNLPLLEDREDVVDQPVKHQTGGEEEKKDAEDEGHELHHLCLHRIGRHGVYARLQHHGAGHQNRQNVIGIERREVMDPQHERGVPKFDRGEQDPVKRNEHRNLHEDREAAAERIDLLRLVELHHCLVHLLPVLSVLL